MQPVSLTAQWTAAIRAKEHERAQGSLFRDELARHLAMPDGFELLERYSGGGVQDFVAIRTRFFDDACNANCESASPIKQIVMVAAGMDTRVYRLAWPEGAHVFELDHAALLEEKAQKLRKNGAKPSVAVTSVPVDFAGDWIERLLSAGFDRSNPTLWLTEGLLFFLTPVQVETLLKTLLAVSAPGSRLVADMTSETIAAHDALVKTAAAVPIELALVSTRGGSGLSQAQAYGYRRDADLQSSGREEGR